MVSDYNHVPDAEAWVVEDINETYLLHGRNFVPLCSATLFYSKERAIAVAKSQMFIGSWLKVRKVRIETTDEVYSAKTGVRPETL